MPANPPTSTIGANIAAARIKRDLSQLALAHLMGWKGGDAGAHISRIENGKGDTKISTLQRIAAALDVTVESLLNGSH